ncbi:MAG: hypothetical protein KAR13_08220 [Desulfobulbaceae bacterium]|nr:hypothetical protein [Desulfobulbaceae bacterium]
MDCRQLADAFYSPRAGLGVTDDNNIGIRLFYQYFKTEIFDGGQGRFHIRFAKEVDSVNSGKYQGARQIRGHILRLTPDIC